MALIEITADLSRVAKALEDIRDLLKRIHPDPEDILMDLAEKPVEVDEKLRKPPDEAWRDYAPRVNYPNQ